jgi:hypothetical protein
MLVQYKNGDITEQLSRVHTSADMVNAVADPERSPCTNLFALLAESDDGECPCR